MHEIIRWMPLRWEGATQSMLAGRVICPEATSAFRASTETAAGGASPPAPATPRASGGLLDERGNSATRCLGGSAGHCGHIGVSVRWVTIENSPCHVSRAFAVACKAPGVKRARTRPCTLMANGNTEHFAQTALAEEGPHPNLRNVQAARRQPSDMEAHARLEPAACHLGTSAANQLQLVLAEPKQAFEAPHPSVLLAGSPCSTLEPPQAGCRHASAPGLPMIGRQPDDAALAGQVGHRGSCLALVEDQTVRSSGHRLRSIRCLLRAMTARKFSTRMDVFMEEGPRPRRSGAQG